jgi:glycerol kinase
MNFIMAIDQGTTGTTACLIDANNFSFVAKINKEYPQIYPTPGQVEHNLNDIWTTVEYTVVELLKKQNISANQIKCIGITNQRETTCAFDKNGKPLAHAIVWQDRRTAEQCLKLKENKELAAKIKNKTGLELDPYFSGSKMQWLLNNNEVVKAAASKSDLRLGTIDTFLLYKLSGCTAFKTDASNASRTMLMDLKTTDWDNELLDVFGVKKEMLPTIEDSFGLFGTTKCLSFLPDGIPITGILGDQQSALFGQAGFSEGEMKCTYGTGAFILLNTGEKLLYSKSGLLTTVEYRYQGKTFYALEGSSYIAGAAVQWLRDNLKIINKSSDVEALALQVKNLDELKYLLFFPFFSGIGSPHWRADAKAAIIGMTRDTKDSHLAFATLEGIALSINDLITALRSDTGLPIKSLKVDGGAVENNLLMNLQASISNTKIIRPKVIETTAFGAALGAAIGAGLVQMNQLGDLWKVDSEFSGSSELNQYASEKRSLWSSTLKNIFIR